MTKNTLKKIRPHLNILEQKISGAIHQPFIETLLTSIEKGPFRIVPMCFGFGAAIVAGISMLATAYFFGYQTTSLTVLGYVFVLGFVIGFVYEYLRSLPEGSK